MKKLKCLTAALLSVAVLVSGAALTACSGDDGASTEDVKEIIKDEQTWDKAFEDIEWVNLSCKVSNEVDHGDGEGYQKLENYAKLTENAVYWKMGDPRNNYGEGYSAKNSDGTYSTYLKEYYNEDSFSLLDDTSDRYYQRIKIQVVLQVSYANYFELFRFEKDTNSYVYDGEIEVIARQAIGNKVEEATLICTNNVVKALNGKIVYIKSDYYVREHPEDTKNASFEYFDIGSTTVEIPDEVKTNAYNP
ncbi:MAG: hypothetical protein K2N47_02490, partial [Clostridia bacterium]|nr:hypothetical protein [Clostridia bacterium]